MVVRGKKTKIVLDADVIIHFAKGGKLEMLPRILPEMKEFARLISKDGLSTHTFVRKYKCYLKTDSFTATGWAGRNGRHAEQRPHLPSTAT